MYNLLLIIYIKFYIILYNQIKDCDIVWNYYYIWSQYKENFDDFAKEWKMAIFCIKIVEACFNYFNIEQEIAGTGRPPFDLILKTRLGSQLHRRRRTALYRPLYKPKLYHLHICDHRYCT